MSCPLRESQIQYAPLHGYTNNSIDLDLRPIQLSYDNMLVEETLSFRGSVEYDQVI